MDATVKKDAKGYYRSWYFWRTAGLVGLFAFGVKFLASTFKVDLGPLSYLLVIVVGAYFDFQARISFHHDCDQSSDG